MNKFSMKLGFFMISIFLVGIPFLTGLRISMVDEIDFFTYCGVMLTLGEVWFLTVFFLIKCE